MNGRVYDESSGSRAVMLVHDQLEALKYIGGFVTGEGNALTESGEGLPLSILTLPDLVLDFNEERLKLLGPVCSIGGHAGHITSVLMHLLSDEDATHRVHLLTYTGRLALRLLADEFRKHDAETAHDTYKRYCLPYVFERDGQPRWAYLSGEDIYPGAPQSADELQAKKHLDENRNVRTMIATVDAVYFGSFKTPDCRALLTKIWAAMGSPLFFLDTRRANQDSRLALIGLLEFLAQRNELPSRSSHLPEVILFVNESEEALLQEAAGSIFGSAVRSLRDISERLEVRVIQYGKHAVNLFSTFDGEAALNGPLYCTNFDFTGPHPSARFRAGLILAACVHKSLEKLNDSNKHRIKECTRGWGKDIEVSFQRRWSEVGGRWRGAAAYGLTLATLPSADGRFSLREILQRFNTHHESSHGRSSPYSLNVPTEAKGGTYRLQLDENTVPRLVALASCRRSPKGLCNPHMAQCGSLSQAHECTIGKQRPAIMIDLDGTLMDSTLERGRALERALKALHSSGGLFDRAIPSAEADFKDELEFFETSVYKKYQFFKWLELGDFREEWNQPGWYAAYIVMNSKPTLAKELTQMEKDWRALTSATTRSEGALEDLRTSGPVMEFLRVYDDVLRNRGVEIGRAIAAFSQVQLHPLKEARDLLRSLSLSEAFNVYIVSEGDPETQWNKLVSIGLDEFFDRSQVLTTGDVAPKYDSERKHFEAEKKDLRTKFDHLEFVRQYPAEKIPALITKIRTKIAGGLPAGATDTERLRAADQLSSFSNDQLLEAVALDTKLAEIKGDMQAAECVEVLLERLGRKLSPAFYAAVIRAIMRNPDRPLDTLRNLQNIRCEQKGTVRMKLAMIGDRQTKDLHPLIELLSRPLGQAPEGLVTIRLISGKYAAVPIGDPDHPDYNDALHQPSFIALTLAHVKSLLLSPDTWRKVHCLDREPPLFNWDVDLYEDERKPRDPESNDERVGISHIVSGMSMSFPDFPVISNICAAFLCEHVGRSGAEALNTIVERLFATAREDRLRRPARIAAFVLAGSLANETVDPVNERVFAHHLVACLVGCHAIGWITARLIKALHWIKDNGRDSVAKRIAADAL